MCTICNKIRYRGGILLYQPLTSKDSLTTLVTRRYTEGTRCVRFTANFEITQKWLESRRIKVSTAVLVGSDYCFRVPWYLGTQIFLGIPGYGCDVQQKLGISKPEPIFHVKCFTCSGKSYLYTAKHYFLLNISRVGDRRVWRMTRNEW
jgi:hypothetical protein